MMMFAIGFMAAWILFGIFFYAREGSGSWSIWRHNWDTILILLPAIPLILIVEIIQDKILKK